MADQELQDLAFTIGRALGTILPALAQFPPIGSKGTDETTNAIGFVLDNSPGIPPEARAVIEGILSSLEHYAATAPD